MFAVRLLFEKVLILASLPLLVPPDIAIKSPSLKPSSTKSLVPVIEEAVVVKRSVKEVLRAAADKVIVIEDAFA